jgi:hypothetical protein
MPAGSCAALPMPGWSRRRISLTSNVAALPMPGFGRIRFSLTSNVAAFPMPGSSLRRFSLTSNVDFHQHCTAYTGHCFNTCCVDLLRFQSLCDGLCFIPDCRT